MFQYCTVIEHNCPFAGDTQGNQHCGIKTGELRETMLENIAKCPKKPKKKR